MSNTASAYSASNDFTAQGEAPGSTMPKPPPTSGQISKGLPTPARKKFGAAARGKEEAEVINTARVSKKFTLSVPFEVDAAVDNVSEKVVANLGNAVRRLVARAAGNVSADAENLLVESIEGTAYFSKCGKAVAISIEGVDGLVTQAAGQVRSDGTLASECNLTAHANEITEGALYVADTSLKHALRNNAKSVGDIHTQESLEAHEDLTRHGLFVHCASPVWSALRGLPEELKQELNVKRSTYNAVVAAVDKGLKPRSALASIKSHVLFDDVDTYGKAKAHLIAQSRANAVHHVDLTTMQVRFADAEGNNLSDLPVALEGAAQSVKAAHSGAVHVGKLDLAVKFYVDVPTSSE